VNRADQMALASWLNDKVVTLRRDAFATSRGGTHRLQIQADTISQLVNEVLSPDWPLAAATGRRKGPRE
jgi:hypothetical protein